MNGKVVYVRGRRKRELAKKRKQRRGWSAQVTAAETWDPGGDCVASNEARGDRVHVPEAPKARVDGLSYPPWLERLP